jgi:hypothetical protein
MQVRRAEICGAKEKGRLLAPLLQSRNETAAKRSPVSPGQADRVKFG